MYFFIKNKKLHNFKMNIFELVYNLYAQYHNVILIAGLNAFHAILKGV